MLNVDGGVNIDTCIQQFVDVLPSALVPAPRGIAVSKFIHQCYCRLSRQQTIEVHFLQNTSLVFDFPTWQLGQSFQQGEGFRSSVSLHNADEHIDALAVQLTCTHQHCVGLPYPWGSP